MVAPKYIEYKGAIYERTDKTDVTGIAEQVPDRGEFGMPGVGHSRMMMLPTEEVGSIFLPVFPRTDLAKRIVKNIAPAVFAHFIKRNNEYGDDNQFNLGSRGQYVDISRKVQKLKRYMWDEVSVPDGAEDVRTICVELIGHLFMTLAYLEDEDGEKEDTTATG